MTPNPLEEETPDVVRVILSRILRAFSDDVKMGVINILASEEMASFRCLSRRLRVNHKRLKSNLKPLLDLGIIEEVQIRVSDGRVYRAYRLSPPARAALNALNNEGK